MTTTEKNILIAEFIGLQTGKQLGYDRWENDWFDNRCVINGQRNEKLFFDSDWNWLMPVVIECFKRYDAVEDNSSNHQFLLDNALLETNIDSLFDAVVNFIIWFNENKK